MDAALRSRIVACIGEALDAEHFRAVGSLVGFIEGQIT